MFRPLAPLPDPSYTEAQFGALNELLRLSCNLVSKLNDVVFCLAGLKTVYAKKS